ncbi:MAG: hypothetical protein HY516_01570 [Candidatus Aenigmarchaeota archaeon]|nr:hypothetical protein [Candidatus Aenigmarchaeota archaeon]
MVFKGCFNLPSWSSIKRFFFEKYKQKTNLKFKCPFCGGKPVIISMQHLPTLSRKLYGEMTAFADIRCNSCNKPLFFSEKEREMKHKEIIEMFRVMLAGTFSAFVALTIYLSNSSASSTNPAGFNLSVLTFLFITLLILLLSSYIQILDKVRTDIRIIHSLERGKK